ncbi:MAG: hypothetical protein LBF77_09915 [Spirochaetaceae bacterium]|jgi:hypothetical protein|nr:hypothetical protein [Spirochaetaceae bacterium]
MADNSILRYPVLTVAINGAPVEKRPSSFSLITDRGLPSVAARLSYPSEFTGGNAGETITVSLVSGEVTMLLFTGEIYDAKSHGAYRDLALTDGYKKLCDTLFNPAYRKEQAKVIVEDALGAAGIGEQKITVPPVKVARFSLVSSPVKICFDLLIKALEEHGCHGLRYFFDAENTFRFGSLDDTAINEGEAVSLETAKSIIRTGAGWVETLPLPVRHSQEVTIDDIPMKTYRTDLLVSQDRSRLRLWVEAS